MAEVVIITRQENADKVIQKWTDSYQHYFVDARMGGFDKKIILDKLKQLPLPINPDKVDEIIGNKSWTRISCIQCSDNVEHAVVINCSEYIEHFCIMCLRDCARALEERIISDFYKKGKRQVTP